MKPQDIEMILEFRTQCGRCGTTYSIRSRMLYPDPPAFKDYVAVMRKNLENTPRECCNRRLPVIGKEWEVLWEGER